MNKNEVLSQFLDLGTRGLQIQSQNTSPLYDINYNSWLLQLSTFCDRHLQDHPYYKKFSYIISQKDFSQILIFFNAIKDDKDYWNQSYNSQATAYKLYSSYPTYPQFDSVSMNTSVSTQPKPLEEIPKHAEGIPTQSKLKVFIVHGHDDAAKQEAARTIQALDYKPIILHEQPDSGKTIIEKIESNTDVAFAVVLYTECDKGRAKEEKIEQERFRARQNVVFEHGYLIGKLGRENVCALVKGDIETPGDITGVVYTKMDVSGAWKLRLVKNMQAAGLAVDANKLLI